MVLFSRPEIVPDSISVSVRNGHQERNVEDRFTVIVRPELGSDLEDRIRPHRRHQRIV